MESPEHRVIAGRYQLRAELGSGSMGTVWSAFDEFLQRPVAVKEMRLPPGFPAAQAEELRERALREARAIASLSHPNVITLHDVVREDDEPFVVMELLNARSLAGLLADNGPLSVAQAAAVGDAIAAALEAAHAAGITHRDVKPGNVLVAKDGRVKLTDFGIARNVSEVTMTSSGMTLGSPAYMAPEVASGKKVSAAADLWGLGATLYSLIEGEPPYDADGDPLATAAAVVHGDVPLPAPGPLAELISELMSKDPRDRPTLADVRDRLFDLRSQPGVPLFGAELFDRDREPAFGGTDQAPARRAAASVDPSDNTAPLAADPGPLPFTPTSSTPTSSTPVEPAPFVRGHHGPLGTTVLTIAAAVLFTAAGAGGFVLARQLGGVDILPAGGGQAVTAAPATQGLVKRTGDAAILKGDRGGTFTVKVPSDWATFVTQQAEGTLPASTLVSYVSADGRHALGVQRFPRYFDTHDVGAYLDGLESYWPSGDFVLVDRSTRSAPEGTVVTYRTVDTASIEPAARPPEEQTTEPNSRILGRTTFALLHRAGSSLWAVSVTVPTEQETRGRTQLFERIVRTFQHG